MFNKDILTCSQVLLWFKNCNLTWPFYNYFDGFIVTSAYLLLKAKNYCKNFSMIGLIKTIVI